MIIHYCQGAWSAIMVAAKNGHTEIVKYLAEAGFDMHYAKEVWLPSYVAI